MKPTQKQLRRLTTLGELADRTGATYDGYLLLSTGDVLTSIADREGAIRHQVVLRDGKLAETKSIRVALN